MGKRILIVTYELAPVNRGGAGVVNSALAEALARAGNDVEVLADMPPAEVAAWQKMVHDRGISGITAHALTTLVPAAPPAPTIFQSKSAHFREGVYSLARNTSFDVVEFFEYAGAAFDTLTLRTPDDAIATTTVAVRIHGSLGVIDHAEGAPASLERLTMHRMEEWSLRCADVVLAPVQSIGDQYRGLYGIDPERIRVCPPPMEAILAEIGGPVAHDPDANQVVFYGKLQPIKGCETFVRAATLAAEARPELRFLLVGADTLTGPGESSMKAHLESLIPWELRDRFRFLPFMDRRELGKLAARSLCAVVPSRAESFCLAAHELHRVGCPLILSDIPAFEFFPDGERCLKFDGTAEDLTVCIERMAIDSSLPGRLSRAGENVVYPDVAATYAAFPAPVPSRGEPFAFARTEVRSLGASSEEARAVAAHAAELRRDIGGVVASKGWRALEQARRIRDRARDPIRRFVERLRS